MFIVLFAVILIGGCTAEQEFAYGDGARFLLTVRCANDLMPTKTPQDGEQAFNENLIQSVDFFFYVGENPDADADAVYRVRKELSSDPMRPGIWEASFSLVIKNDIVSTIFAQNNRATVYALVNYDGEIAEDLSNTSINDFAATLVVTDFAATETNRIQPKFLMDGRKVVVFTEHGDPEVNDEIQVSRFASKLTVAVHVEPRVELKHLDESGEEDEVWTPVLNTMRAYLVDGFKTVALSESGVAPNPQRFKYKNTARPYLGDDGTPYLSTETVHDASGDKLYYNTWPMYSYPAGWSYDSLPDYDHDYTQGAPQTQPYIKLEMDWRREAENNYSYDRRKYYYKIILPFNQFERNNWYGFYVDVSILGSETDEGKAVLEPTCYLLDWQNKSFAINKYAVISKARYLAVDKTRWDIDNMEQLSIPFTSSHDVVIVPGTVKATRPFYGELTGGLAVEGYHEKLHGWIKQNADGSLYLQFHNQKEGAKYQPYEPSNWLTNTSTSIVLNHSLVNVFTEDDFDYSPYTITFDIVHRDLVDDRTSYSYQQYVRHITIVQYPAIFIQKLTNRDTEIVKRNGDSNNPYGYPDGELPWKDKPWGYAYVNGGRFVRVDKKSNSQSADPFFKLTTANCKREYQWQTIWYTGGSRDMFDIHVTVLPQSSDFVIGDPRVSDVNNLDSKELYPNLYEFVVDGANATAIKNNHEILEAIRDWDPVTNPYGTYEHGTDVYYRTGFNVAKALYGDEEYRALKWYYPTEKSTRTENMLAPSYRVASKFGGTEYGGSFFGDITRQYAEYRCAAYQEDGFPAGRWRLPTKAEIHFIGQLSAKKVFEPLFTKGSTYWSAHGGVTVGDGTVSNSTSSTALLRCVYDSWYWDKVDAREGDPRQDDPTVFVWGDKER